MEVIRILECIFIDKKVSHLIDPYSVYFRISEKVTTSSRNEDGTPEEKTETISRPALNMEDWMIHHPKLEQQIAMERDTAVVRKTLELAMGSDFLKTFHENSEKANVIMRSQLPYQVWDKVKRRLITQQVRSTQHMRTNLGENEYHIGEDFNAFRVKFNGQIENIEKSSNDQLLDKESIPILLGCIKGRKQADHPLNQVCTRINQLMEDTKYNAVHFPDLPVLPAASTSTLPVELQLQQLLRSSLVTFLTVACVACAGSALPRTILTGDSALLSSDNVLIPLRLLLQTIS
uniref:Uncharacterized protein n=1 Tax=Heterosigma akashiwo TaxID=2829 RepID=A0A7S4DA01_HETAK